MTKPLNEFGGYLVFFRISNFVFFIISLVSVPLLLLAVVRTIAENMPTATSALIFSLSLTISSILIFKMLKVLKIQESFVPKKIVNFIFLLTIFSISFSLLNFVSKFLFLGFNQETAMETSKQMINSIVWFLIWRSYFKKSKRVLAYYGKNAS